MSRNRYRDLIHSADSIIEMKTTTENIQSHLSSVEESASKLQHLIRSSISPSLDEKKGSSHFFGIATEVRKIGNGYIE